MFKASTKRKNPTGTRRRSHEEGENEEQEGAASAFVQATKLKQQKKKRNANRELADGEAMEAKKSSKKKKSQRMGFGGAITSAEETNETTTSRLYSKAYLEQLKAEQRDLKLPKTDNTFAAQPVQTAATTAESSSQQLEEFITLDSNINVSSSQGNQVEILAGDEAMAFENDDGNLNFNDDLEKALLDDTKEDDEWQDQLTRRAKWGPAPVGTEARPSATAKPKQVNTSLSQFQDHVAKTLETLKTQKQTIQDQIRRREDQLVETEGNMEKHKVEVVKVGTALEFYQRWRIRLCEFISTLRTVQTSLNNVRLVAQSWHADVANIETWTRTWQDDVAQTLHLCQSLDQVLGRPVELRDETDGTTDEFGRVVQSRDALLREKRAVRRDRIQSQYQKRHMPKADTLIRGDHINLEDKPSILRGDESDALWSEDEEESLRTRHSALKEAIMVACDSAEHSECIVLQNLFDLFQEWYAAHPDEYKQCYAALSLADLASVLISAEMLLLNDPWDDSSGYTEMKWTAVVHSALKDGYMDGAAVDRLVEKTAIPILTDLFDFKGVNFISRRQVRSVGMFVEHMLHILPKDEPAQPPKSSTRLLDLVSQFTVDSLDSIAVPITSRPTEVSGYATQQMSSMERAEYDATWGQMRRLRKIVTNLVDLWGPFMKSNMMFATAVLDFVSNRFLYTLSSMGEVTGDGLRQSKFDDFSAIYISIKDNTNWLDDPALMLPSSPVTAAALAYQIAEEKDDSSS